jgi:hypothetical protein
LAITLGTAIHSIDSVAIVASSVGGQAYTKVVRQTNFHDILVNAPRCFNIIELVLLLEAFSRQALSMVMLRLVCPYQF